MNSKFFATHQFDFGNDSDTSSTPNSKINNNKATNIKFDDDFSSEDEQKRVVRSNKDKRYEAIKKIINRINDKIKIEDFIALLDEFEELNKQLEKAKKITEKEGIPLFYIRICSFLEEFVENLSLEDKNKLKPANKKAYNILKHKIKKNNKLYGGSIQSFKEVNINIEPNLTLSLESSVF